MKKKLLIVNWGTATSINVLRECVQLKRYDFYLVSTPEITEDIKALFGEEKIVIANPYDPIVLCEDVSRFMERNDIRFDVVTTFFEMCVYQTAFLADYLGIEKRLCLKDALNTSVNKYLMRLKVGAAGLLQPKYFLFDKYLLKEAYGFYRSLMKDAVIKPVHSGHSYGVRYIKKGMDFGQFKRFIEDAKKDYKQNYDEWMKYENTKKLQFLLEEFIGGKIYSFDGVIGEEDNICFIGSTEFELSAPPVMKQIGHTIPIYSLGTNRINDCKTYVKKVVEALNLRYCGFHCEIKYLSDKPVLIEISGRLPGGIITSAYQNLSEYNVIDRFLSVFDQGTRKTIIKNKMFYKSETMRIIYSDKDVGVVRDSAGDVYQESEDFLYKIRSRKEGEEIDEAGNPFGVWLYEIVLRSKTLSSRELVVEREKLIDRQKIRVESKSRIYKIIRYIARIQNKLINR